MNRLIIIAAAAAATIIAVIITAASGAEPSTVMVAGLGAAGVVGFIAPALTRFLTTARGPAVENVFDIVGAQGLVVSQIPYDGQGTVSLKSAGQLRTLNAKAPYPIGVGRLVVVTAVVSETSVLVEAADPPQAQPPDDRPV
ncbi:MAG: hypothetical protein ACRDV9_10655 [Acidimicrobiia bacterium]